MRYHLFLFAISLFAFSCQPAFAQASDSKILYVDQTATVADLFSTTDGSTIHFPDCKYFKFSYDKQNQQAERLFYAINTHRMPMQSFIQFIKNGHTLFQDDKIRRTYATAVNTATRAQRQVNFKPTATAISRLETAKKEMFQLLQTLPLNDKKVRTSLEKVLNSTSPAPARTAAIKHILKFVGIVGGIFLWIPFCTVATSLFLVMLSGDVSLTLAGHIYGNYIGITSLTYYGLYRIFTRKKHAKADLFDYAEKQPVIIQIQIKPTIDASIKTEETLDLTMTPSKDS